MLSRDEAKDVFDIVSIAENYSFNWRVAYEQATRKQLMNEEDVLMRISDDFLLAKDNSLGAGKTPIEKATPHLKTPHPPTPSPEGEGESVHQA